MKQNPASLILAICLFIVFIALNIPADFSLKYSALLVVFIFFHLTFSHRIAKYLLPEFYFFMVYPSTTSFLFFGGLVLCRSILKQWHQHNAVESKGALMLAAGPIQWPMCNNDRGFTTSLGLQIFCGVLQRFLPVQVAFLNTMPAFLFLFWIVSCVFTEHKKESL